MGYYTQENFKDYFWNRFNKTETCWLWTGRLKQPSGYGTIQKDKKTFYVHRLSYILTFGDIPDDLIIRHKCDVKHCGNPAHLEMGTQADNMKDCVERGRKPIGELHYQGKLNDKSVDAIRLRYWIENESSGKLAKEFGVSSGTILEVVHGRIWKHLPNYQRPRKYKLSKSF